jgi:starvation-inducible DNA-binding protein
MNKKATVDAVATSASFSNEAVTEISEALRRLLADICCHYFKTKNFHWPMTGRNFGDYHLLLDEQADQVFAMTDLIPERGQKIGGSTLRSVGECSRRQRLRDNDEESLTPQKMLSELRDDNSLLTAYLRETHEICAKYNDVATTSLIEVWIDEPEKRRWFIGETVTR